jgi:pimeloyl-ACP methyl ester carboxylesterase
MRKPAEVRSDADLQAIQTSVAFKNISDAIEQYRRQFGLAFLALIAFSAIHVGLVVIANLYTLETRVSNGVLSSAADTSARPQAVATSKAVEKVDLATIMASGSESEQKRYLTNLNSVDFVDADGTYRKYTVTGFQLGGYKKSELKLYTSVGHLLEYVRGKGLRVYTTSETAAPEKENTTDRRGLQLQTFGFEYMQVRSGITPIASDVCADSVFATALDSGWLVQEVFQNNGETEWEHINTHTQNLVSFGNQMADCYYNNGHSWTSYAIHYIDQWVANNVEDYGPGGSKVQNTMCLPDFRSNATVTNCGLTDASDDSTGHKVFDWSGAAGDQEDVQTSFGDFDKVLDNDCLADQFELNLNYSKEQAARTWTKAEVQTQFNIYIGQLNDWKLIFEYAQSSDVNLAQTIENWMGNNHINLATTISTAIAMDKATQSTRQELEDALAKIDTKMRAVFDNYQTCTTQNENFVMTQMMVFATELKDWMTTSTDEVAEVEQLLMDGIAEFMQQYSHIPGTNDTEALKCSFTASLAVYQAQTGETCAPTVELIPPVGANIALWKSAYHCVSFTSWNQYGCATQSIYNYFFSEMQTEWLRLENTYSEDMENDWQLFEAEVESESAEYEAYWGTDTSDAINLFLTEAQAVGGYIDQIIANETEIFLDYTSDNVWTSFKEKPSTMETVSSSSLGGWGCSTISLSDLRLADTEINLFAFDSCQAGQGTREMPFVIGFMFSEILGAYDAFSIFVNKNFCTELLTKAAAGQDFIHGYQWDTSILAEYVLMLHGFAGNKDFLSFGAASFNFANNGVMTNYLVHQDVAAFTPCTSWGNSGGVPSGCKSYVAPGGFMIAAPDAAGVPMALKHWYTNQDFSGFVMDYICFELPSFFTSHMGIMSRAVGMFGFSMGGYGSMNVVTYYPTMVDAFASFNAPIYPNDCAFTFSCHSSCAIDMILCELLFTTVAAAHNPYVILFKGSMVLSAGAMDPMGMGVAYHLWANTNGILECGQVSTVYSSVNDPVTYYAADVTITSSGLSWQQWTDEFTCTMQAMKTGIANAGFYYGNVSASSYGSDDDDFSWADQTSMRIIMLGRTSLTTNFKCTGTCKNFGQINTGYLGFGSADDDSDGEIPCPMYFCPSITWSFEANLAEGHLMYLDPVAATVAAMKFVPFSHPTADTPVASSFSNFLVGQPLLRLVDDHNIYSVSAVLMFLHCSQNDEYGLYEQHTDYVQVLAYVGTSSCTVQTSDLSSHSANYVAGDACIQEHSIYLVDFGDCDWHSYSQRDLKATTLWFSDALRVYPNDMTGSTDMNSKNFALFGLCFLDAYDFTPTASHGVAKTTCSIANFRSDADSDTLWTFPSAYSVSEWAWVASATEHGASAESIQEENEVTAEHTAGCDLSSEIGSSQLPMCDEPAGAGLAPPACIDSSSWDDDWYDSDEGFRHRMLLEDASLANAAENSITCVTIDTFNQDDCDNYAYFMANYAMCQSGGGCSGGMVRRHLLVVGDNGSCGTSGSPPGGEYYNEPPPAAGYR